MPFPVAVWRKVEWTKVWSRLIFVVDVILLCYNLDIKVKLMLDQKYTAKYEILDDFAAVSCEFRLNWCHGQTCTRSSGRASRADLCLLHLLTRHLSIHSTCISGTKRIWKCGTFFTFCFTIHPSARVPSSRRTPYVLLQELMQTIEKDCPKMIIWSPYQGPRQSNPCQRTPGQTICFGGWLVGEQSLRRGGGEGEP